MVEEKNTKVEKEVTSKVDTKAVKTPIVEKKTETVKTPVVEKENEAPKKIEAVKKSKPSIEDVKAKIKKKAAKEEKKIELERIYVVPLRKGYMKVPQYKRAKKAVKTLKEFLAKHMRVEERDLNKVKIDIYLNNEIWFKGIKKPLNKVKVKATKIDGIVYAELAEVPEIVKFKMDQDARRRNKVDKKALNKVVTKEAAEEKIKEGRSDKADKTEESEKEKASAEAGVAKQKVDAKEAKHTAKVKSAKQDNMSSTTMRKAMKK